MAYRLKSRQKQIPGGFTFLQPQTGWRPPRFASFETVVRMLIAHRAANSGLTRQHNLLMDYDLVCNEVDTYNAQICLQNGWKQYIQGGEGDAPPLPQRPRNLVARLGDVVAGAKVIVEWLRTGGDAVPQELAESRAATCVACPLNQKGDLLRFFTKPVSEAIRAALNQRSEWKLSTTKDEQLGVCAGCLCPMKLKVHVPLKLIKDEMPKEVAGELDPKCWVLNEK